MLLGWAKQKENLPMHPSDDPLNHLSPEQRQRVEAALRGLGAGGAEIRPPVYASFPAGVPLQQASGQQAWAQWDYTAEEWAVFDQVDWRPRQRLFWLLVSGCLVFLFATLLAVLHQLSTSAEDTGAFLLATLLTVGAPIPALALLIGSVVYLAPYRAARKRHQARQNPARPHQVTITRHGVWEAGTFFPLDDAALQVYVREVKLTTEPLVLHFRCALGSSSIISDSDGTSAVAQPQTTTVRVLVPRREEAGAANLLQRFRAQVLRTPF